MKKLMLPILTITLSLILVGCNSDTSEKSNNTQNDNTDNQEKTEEKNKDNATKEESENNEDSNDDKTESSREGNDKHNTNKNDNNKTDSEGKQTKNKKESYLDDYSAKEIEYARIWYQLRTYASDAKSTKHIKIIKKPKGSKVAPNYEHSAVYKEDVVQIIPLRSTEKPVTYSSNGDGTINYYKGMPAQWLQPNSGKKVDMYDVTKKAVEDNEQSFYIKPFDNKRVEEIASNIKYEN
ncbi:hypothetical protein QI276_10255 [Staphylococcus saprophyticus]|nr:hypothetical protein [Staphylococcus saprophyticus]